MQAHLLRNDQCSIEVPRQTTGPRPQGDDPETRKGRRRQDKSKTKSRHTALGHQL